VWSWQNHIPFPFDLLSRASYLNLSFPVPHQQHPLTAVDQIMPAVSKSSLIKINKFLEVLENVNLQRKRLTPRERPPATPSRFPTRSKRLCLETDFPVRQLERDPRAPPAPRPPKYIGPPLPLLPPPPLSLMFTTLSPAPPPPPEPGERGPHELKFSSPPNYKLSFT